MANATLSSLRPLRTLAMAVALWSGGGLARAAPAAAAECGPERRRGAGPVYYVCDCSAGHPDVGPTAALRCEPGSDANTGTSPAAPWRSWRRAAAAFGTMPAGGTVALCRGGRWDITGQAPSGSGGGPLNNVRCRVDETCDLRDYAPRWGRGEEGMPVLAASGTTDTPFTLGWYNADHPVVRGLRFLNIHTVGGDSSATIWGNVTDVDFCHVVFDGHRHTTWGGMSIGRTQTVARVRLRHSRILNMRSQGFIGGCTDCSVDHNYFDGNGGGCTSTDDCVRNHAIYVSSSPAGGPYCGASGCYAVTRGMRVTDNEITRSASFEGRCWGAPVVVHEPWDGLVIQNNYIHETAAAPQCWGISVSTGLDAPGAFFNVVIRGNRIYNVGGVGIGVENCQGCVIDGNIIATASGMTGIKAPTRARGSGGETDVTNTATVVSNNTLYYAASADGDVGIFVGTEGDDHVVTNNAIHYAAPPGRNGWTCFALDGPVSSYRAVDHNVCFHPRGGSWEASHGTLAGWRAATGQRLDAHSSEADPMFVRPTTDPTTADFEARPGSPLLDRGGATPRPAGAAPEVGAHSQ